MLYLSVQRENHRASPTWRGLAGQEVEQLARVGMRELREHDQQAGHQGRALAGAQLGDQRGHHLPKPQFLRSSLGNFPGFLLFFCRF